jgi:hypothetical protein
MVRRLPIWLLLLAAVSVPARADQSVSGASAAWRNADQCAKDAFKKYPDYTPQSNAAREAMRRECLRNHRLPDSSNGS